MEIIIKDPDNISAMDIVNAELQVAKMVKQLKAYRNIYAEEMAELKKNIHVTRDGTAIFVDKMDNDHLINTALLCDRHGHENQKFLNEIKKRNLVALYMQKLTAQDNEEAKEDDRILICNPY